MQRDLAALSQKKYQVIIVGGGITGACLAHDAALRGLSVLLLEQGDFGERTSSASSKLLHGGIRYLPYGQVWKVRESFRETCIFQRIAPHLTTWIPFLIPTTGASLKKSAFALKVGMRLYALCGAGLRALITDAGKLPPAAPFFDRGESIREVPLLAGLPRLSGAQMLWESHMHNSERMTLAFVKSAAARGACAANYTRVKKFVLTEGGRRVSGVEAEDRISGKQYRFQADLLINAAGPFVQRLNETVPQLSLGRPLTGFSKGVHLVTRQIHPRYALALSTRKKTGGLISRGGRHFFIIPWRGRSLIGTTNVPFQGNLEDLRVSAEDVDDFIQDINGALPGLNLSRADVFYAYAGLYPLVAREIKADTYQGTGRYQTVDHEINSGVAGIITVLGAKFTTARCLAEKGIDLAMRKLGLPDPGCATKETPLLEGNIASLPGFLAACQQEYGRLLPQARLLSLIHNHGAETPALLEEGRRRGLLARVDSARETLQIEVDWAIEHEMALSLDDLLFRRSGLGTIGPISEEALLWCVRRMADAYAWDEPEQARQLARVRERYEWR